MEGKIEIKVLKLHMIMLWHSRIDDIDSKAVNLG